MNHALAAINLALLVFFVPVIVILLRARTKGRRWAGAWLLTLAPLYVPVMEDGFLAMWYALASPQVDPHGIAGIVEPHAQGHVLGAGVATIALGILAAWIARRPLARGEPWAWKCLLTLGIAVNAVALLELVFYFDHGLPLSTFAEHGGFGWAPWLAAFLAWGAGLWLARPPHKPAAAVNTVDALRPSTAESEEPAAP